MNDIACSLTRIYHLNSQHPHWVPSCSQSHGFVFILSSLVPGLHTLTPRGALAFLHGICMTGWVDFANTPHTVCAFSVFVIVDVNLAFASSTLNKSPLFVSLYVCVLGLFFVLLHVCPCVSPCIFVFTCRDPRPAASLPQPYRTLPSLSSLFLCPISFWLRCSRRHSQTHSGVLTQSGRHTEWPAASQAGLQRFGLVARQPCWKWVSFSVPEDRTLRHKTKYCATLNHRLCWNLSHVMHHKRCLAQPEEI